MVEFYPGVRSISCSARTPLLIENHQVATLSTRGGEETPGDGQLLAPVEGNVPGLMEQVDG